MLNFLRKLWAKLIEARLESAYYGVAGYIKNEYSTGLSQGDIAQQLKRDGYDKVIYKITH